MKLVYHIVDATTSTRVEAFVFEVGSEAYAVETTVGAKRTHIAVCPTVEQAKRRAEQAVQDALMVVHALAPLRCIERLRAAWCCSRKTTAHDA